MNPVVRSKTHAPGYTDPGSARLTLAGRDDSSKAKRRPVGSRASGSRQPYRLRLHNPVTLPVDYAGKLWCEQRQEA